MEKKHESIKSESGYRYVAIKSERWYKYVLH